MILVQILIANLNRGHASFNIAYGMCSKEQETYHILGTDQRKRPLSMRPFEGHVKRPGFNFNFKESAGLALS